MLSYLDCDIFVLMARTLAVFASAGGGLCCMYANMARRMMSLRSGFAGGR